MAITLISSPSSNVSSHNPIEWKLQLSAMGTLPVIKRVLYYLADGAGTRFSEIYVWTPTATTEIFTIDAKTVVKSLLNTSFPVNGTGITTDLTAYKTIKLYYAESSFDTSTCIDTVGSYTITSTITVYNLSLNFDTENAFVWSGGKTGSLMNSYPTNMRATTESDISLWFAGVGSIRLTWYNSAGTSLYTITHTMTGSTAKYISLDWRVHSVAKPALLKYEVNSGLGYVDYFIRYDNCSCIDYYTSIKFLDPLGGRSDASINCEMSIDLQRSVNEFNQYGATITTKGKSNINAFVNEKLKFIVPIGKYSTDLSFAKALLSSSGHHILKIDSAGNKKWYKFLLDSGTINFKTKSESNYIEISGSFADNKGQTIDI